MKSVMISIKPKWCELIANGRKTIEVRKTKPKIKTPFKCYIYCTKGFYRNGDGYFQGKYCGKVIGEFLCDRMDTYDDDTIHAFSYENYARWNDYDLYQSCIHPEDFEKYAADEWLYGWHISDLVIYDNPRELKNFWKAGKCQYVTENGCTYSGHCFRSGQTNRCGEPLTRPPQSWCYVEEVRK